MTRPNGLTTKPLETTTDEDTAEVKGSTMTSTPVCVPTAAPQTRRNTDSHTDRRKRARPTRFLRVPVLSWTSPPVNTKKRVVRCPALNIPEKILRLRIRHALLRVSDPADRPSLTRPASTTGVTRATKLPFVRPWP